MDIKIANRLLCVAMTILSLFFFFVKFTSNAYRLRIPGIVLLVLVYCSFRESVFNEQRILDIPTWLIEASLYMMLIVSIYRSALRQLLKETSEMAKIVKQAKAKIPQMIQSSPYPIIISD